MNRFIRDTKTADPTRQETPQFPRPVLLENSSYDDQQFIEDSHRRTYPHLSLNPLNGNSLY